MTRFINIVCHLSKVFLEVLFLCFGDEKRNKSLLKSVQTQRRENRDNSNFLFSLNIYFSLNYFILGDEDENISNHSSFIFHKYQQKNLEKKEKYLKEFSLQKMSLQNQYKLKSLKELKNF